MPADLAFVCADRVSFELILRHHRRQSYYDAAIPIGGEDLTLAIACNRKRLFIEFNMAEPAAVEIAG